MCADCDFERLTQELNAALVSRSNEDRDAVEREWCEMIVGNYGAECFGKMQTLRAMLASARIHGVHEGKRMARETGIPTWERVATWGAGFAILLIMGIVILRNERISDPNIVVFIRVLLSVLGGILVAGVSGMFLIHGGWSGFKFRATAGFAMVFLIYFFTPFVMLDGARASTVKEGEGVPSVKDREMTPEKNAGDGK